MNWTKRKNFDKNGVRTNWYNHYTTVPVGSFNLNLLHAQRLSNSSNWSNWYRYRETLISLIAANLNAPITRLGYVSGPTARIITRTVTWTKNFPYLYRWSLNQTSVLMTDIMYSFVAETSMPGIDVANATEYSTLVTQETSIPSKEEEIARLLNLVIRPVLVVFGTIGNGLSFYIMRQGPLKKMSTCFYLSILALVDTSKCVVFCFIYKQEYIPVGCVPPACWLYFPACTAQGVSALGGVCSMDGCLLLGGVCSGGCLLRGVSQHALRQKPPCIQNSWHTVLKILPCPKLRLRAVTKNVSLNVCDQEISFWMWVKSEQW